jgi:hypothetical protein
MITPRNVILTVLVVLPLALAWGVLSMLGPPDSDGRAADSYGTRNNGQRGLYETMSELGLSVSRSLEPPGSQLPFDTTVVLWRPHGRLVAFEPVFLQELGDWVEAGGRVVLTPPEELNEFESMAMGDIPVKDETTTLWDAMHLTKRRLSTVYAPVTENSSPKARTFDAPPGVLPFIRELPHPVAVDVEAHGDLAPLASDVHQLELSDGGTVAIDVEAGDSDGALTFTDPDDNERSVVRRFQVGQGEVVVVGDPQLFSNRFLAKADNSVLAVHLLRGDRQKVQFNEFYHGLSVRGNPLWLLTRRGYALLAAAIVGVVAVVTWRSAVLLGPPLTTPEPSRRTVAEYIDAMSRFLNRGRRTRLRLLQEVYSGTLRRIAAEYGMTHSREDSKAIVDVVARRERGRAERIRDTAAAVDAVLAKHDKATEKETIQALRQLQDCLSDFRF